MSEKPKGRCVVKTYIETARAISDDDSVLSLLITEGLRTNEARNKNAEHGADQAAHGGISADASKATSGNKEKAKDR